MNTLRLITASLLFAGVAGTASAATAFVGQVEPDYTMTRSEQTTAEVRAAARQQEQTSPYLVSGDTFVPTTVTAGADAVRAREAGRDMPRMGYRPTAGSTPVFIGG
ncbi:MAG TPA: hypothetical protein PKA20_21960 [Burkholderiaceae bacterium]|nr:hypothetical protein [Burkholderiaceae bacterium]